ncbi:hypothetical protein ML462_01505 [Gramella lutea]|uniref:Uncharacterized protein n=1 Tax=Christiangramia lutea TaxID=1607951 RepID=A0A9X1V0C6_9FLAO|nr:hypothetical protein [Christiangramia lutea]MCH4821835.1 hypothetical protein [Christiangramia lutea]
MHYAEKKKTIELLEKLRILNNKSAYIYNIISGRESRLILKNFYHKLYRQKIEFLEEIEGKIEQIKREISPIRDKKLLSFYKRKKCALSEHYLRYKLKQNHADIKKREEKSYKKYDKYLSKTSHCDVREVFLKHKHIIKENLKQINSMGIMKYAMV